MKTEKEIEAMARAIVDWGHKHNAVGIPTSELYVGSVLRLAEAYENGTINDLKIPRFRRIDLMTEEDLAEFLFDRISEGGLCAACPMHAECDFYKDDAGCADNLARYLLSPTESEEKK